MFLSINESGIAIGFMSVVFTVALIGVGGLGWYVLHCDAQNRKGESQLAGLGEPDVDSDGGTQTHS